MIDESTIDQICDFINSKINLPLLNETQERILFRAAITMMLSFFLVRAQKKTAV